MFLVRQAKPIDVGILQRLARMVYFINLPPEEKLLLAKIEHSQASFVKAAGGTRPPAKPDARSRRRSGHAGFAQTETESDHFMFTMLDLESDAVVGTSQIRAHQGGPGNPNWSMQVSEKSFRSEPLGIGTTHKVARLYGDETGPSELGGLILQPSHRGHRLRPGRLLSFVRFHFLALHRELFSDRIIAEMMGSVTPDGDNLFWDHFGRKFIPVRFAEADRFCQHNRKFISELLPKEEIYLTLFPLEVQNMLGVVPRETVPARRLLESLGFQHRNFIDPFDGGPHLEAATQTIPLVRDTALLELGKPIPAAKCTDHGIVSTLTPEGEFRAVETPCEVHADRELRLPPDALQRLEGAAGAACGFTPLRPWDETPHADDHSGRNATAPAKRPARRRVRAQGAP